MADENIWDPNPPKEERQPEPGGKPPAGMRNVGFNLLALAFYTIICGFIRDGGIIFDAILIACHFFVCLIMAAVEQKWVWALSALAVLLIGFSTCAGILWKFQ